MPLKSFVFLARKNTPESRQYDPSKPLNNFIDATETAMLQRADATGTKVNWETCKFIKKDPTGKCLCSQFFSQCVQTKCNPKFIKC